uniref:Cyclosome subunit 16 n=1 Tax=Plectus sambesii TaxID=2011161 RepID=A0A914WM02_9BILA
MADAAGSNESRLTKNGEPLPIKALFQSPQQAKNSSKLSDVTEEIFLQAQIDEHLQRAKQKLERELHKERLASLRKVVEQLGEDEWRFSSADELLGLR